MLGLYLVLIVLVWFGIVLAMATWLTWRIERVPLRLLVALVLLAVMLPLPLIDEIVGRHQFEKLCRENATIKIDRTKAAGKTVYFARRPPEDAKGTWLRIVVQPHVFVDAETGEPVVSYNMLTAVGGRFLRHFSEGKVPLLFNGSCGPPVNVTDVFKELRITARDPSNEPTKD